MEAASGNHARTLEVLKNAETEETGRFRPSLFRAVQRIYVAQSRRNAETERLEVCLKEELARAGFTIVERQEDGDAVLVVRAGAQEAFLWDGVTAFYLPLEGSLGVCSRTSSTSGLSY